MIEYPDSARENGIEGKVVIRILVNEDGYVIGDKGLMEGNLVFYTEVKRCVYKLKFTPAKMNGLPTKCYINIPFNFTLIHKDKEEE
jgi:protein TonB